MRYQKVSRSSKSSLSKIVWIKNYNYKNVFLHKWKEIQFVSIIFAKQIVEIENNKEKYYCTKLKKSESIIDMMMQWRHIG